jgi:hypothetical protein
MSTSEQVQLTEKYLKKVPDRSRLKELMMQNVNFAKVLPRAWGVLNVLINISAVLCTVS